MANNPDDINLPPLPPSKAIEPMHSEDAMRDYARAAVIADRERRTKPEAVKVPEKVYRTDFRPFENHSVGICYTESGRVWIDSEERREAARRMRDIASNCYVSDSNNAALHEAADLLDGGKR